MAASTRWKIARKDFLSVVLWVTVLCTMEYLVLLYIDQEPKQQITVAESSLDYSDFSQTYYNVRASHLNRSETTTKPEPVWKGVEIMAAKNLSASMIVITDTATGQNKDRTNGVQTLTSDHWPVLSKSTYNFAIDPTAFKPTFKIKWDFNTSAFLERPDVKGKTPKIITWMVNTRYIPNLPEPVRLRVCPEMPCLMTTNRQYQSKSAALVYDGQIMRDQAPPTRTNSDQVIVFHNNEPQTVDWVRGAIFRNEAWKSAFNWTFTYRFDSDIIGPYGFVVKRPVPIEKNYTAIMEKKTKMVAWLVSHCKTYGKREDYVQLMRKHNLTVDVYGGCGPLKCEHNQDNSCFDKFSTEYKFVLGFESCFCTDYISEKFYRYLSSDTDTVMVARGSNEYKNVAPTDIFINTADFNTTKALVDHLLYLDSHPDEYVKLLKAKHQYQALYADWPIRNNQGHIFFMAYDYEVVGYCEMCRRLWDLEHHRKSIPDIVSWFDRGNCYNPSDIK